jgi:YidC/Oxa1 family membrane protein insertase
MDRTAWIAVALCVIGLVAWEFWVYKQTPPPRPAPALSSSPTASPVVATASASPLASAVPSASPSATAEPTPSFTEKTETLRNNDAELRLTNRGGGISEVVLLNHAAEGDKRVTLNSPQQIPIGAIIDQPETPSLPEFNLSRESDGSVKFERTTPEKMTIRKKFFFVKTSEAKDDFHVELDVDLVNDGSGAPYENPGYYISLGSAVPIHARDYPYYTRLVWCIDGKAHDKNVSWFEGGSGILGMGQRTPQLFYQENTAPAEWCAVTNQFFTTLIAPLNAKANGIWGRRLDIAPEQKRFGLAGAMRMPGFQVAPGQTYSARFEIWTGPKIYHRLAQLDHSEAEIMNFGMFKLVSQFLLNFMNLLHGVLGNSYAVAILALTTIIRLVLWPLQSKANRSMRQTAALAPKVQELREKYKDPKDAAKMNQEVMKLYKEYGINPVGGCLPMVIQIPIFFGLYQMLAQAVELRNAKFLWVRDLSQPDTIAQLPGIGWNINIIPLCMAATQIWLMAMTPKTGDATQRRVMMFTPLIFLFICYNFAAALALYYTTQNLFSILQFYLNKKQPMPKLEKVPATKRK